MADKQRESSEQREPIDDTSVATDIDGNVEPNEEHGSAAVDCPAGVSQAAERYAPDDQAPDMEDEQATLVVEQQSDETGKTVKTDPFSDLGDQTNVNNDCSNWDQSNAQRNKNLNPDILGQDVKSGSTSQNLNTDPPDLNSGTPDPDQALEVGPLDPDLNGGSPNHSSDSASPQDSNNQSPIQESSDSPSEQDLSSGLSTNDSAEAEKTQEDSGSDDKEQLESGVVDAAVSQPEPDQNIENTVPVTEEMNINAAEEVPVSEELQQSLIVEDERLVTDLNANGHPQADDNQEINTEGEITQTADSSNEVASSPQPPPIQEKMDTDNAEGTSADVDPNRTSSSPHHLVQKQPVAHNAEGVFDNVVDNSNGMSTSPQPLIQDQTEVDNAPNLMQQNNNNELKKRKQFANGSVHIPTADVGYLVESVSNRGSRGDLRDPAMHKIRSSLPMDAYGDSSSRHLPALIHPGPHLAHSLPASIDHTNIPNGYYNGYPHHRGSHRTRNHVSRIPSASGSSKTDMREGDIRRALNSAKLPPSVIKMSTVMVSARKRAVLNRNASVFYEERQHSKVISLDQAINSRPPMPFDLDGPGPWSYSPRNKPLNEDNAPEYTFGHRLNEKSGGGRTAYAKTWFNSNSGFTQKVNYEKRWPSPAHYNSTRPLLGCRKPTMLDYPSFTIGVKSNFSISKRGSENEPAPNEYNRSKSDAAILRTAPRYTISHRYQGTKLWGGNEITPGPGAYTPRWGHSSGTVHHPSFTIQGVRRTKSHQHGPHSTL